MGWLYMDGQDLAGRGPSPPWAYPALLSVLWAPLARARFAVRKGRLLLSLWFMTVGMCLIDLRVVFADFSWCSGVAVMGWFGW